MQNKANFGNEQMDISLYTTGLYGIFRLCGRRKTKPIQTQFLAPLFRVPYTLEFSQYKVQN
jgi:hypothetical protein